MHWDVYVRPAQVTQGRAGEADLQALRDAFELAVMSSISHPSLVNIITFFTGNGGAWGTSWP
jgi:hypothetical protein